MNRARELYDADLSFIHDAGYGDYARDALSHILAMLHESGVTAGRHVVDLGCGSGILARGLVDAGYRVTGFDASPDMVDLARECVPEASFEVGALPDVALPACDAVVSTGHVLSYLPDEDAIRATFERVAPALRSGGLFVFELETLDRSSAPLHVREGDDWMIVTRHVREPRRLTRQITAFRRAGGDLWRRTRYDHVTVLCDTAAARTWLREAGFSVRTRRNYDGSNALPGVTVFVARRRGGGKVLRDPASN